MGNNSNIKGNEVAHMMDVQYPYISTLQGPQN